MTMKRAAGWRPGYRNQRKFTPQCWIYRTDVCRMGNMERLRAAVTQLEAKDPSFIDPRELSRLVDRLQAKLAEVVHRGAQRGDNTLEGKTVHGWVASTC